MNKRCYYFLLLALLLSGANSLFAQNYGERDDAIFYLRNGLICYGDVQFDRQDSIHLKQRNGSLIRFAKSDIKKYLGPNERLAFRNGKFLINKGIFFSMGLGLNALNTFYETDSRISTHLPFILGYQFSDKWAAGTGLSFEFNEARAAGLFFSSNYTALFGYGRYYLNEKPKRLYSYARAGYGFPTEENFFGRQDGGYQAQVGLGLVFASRKHSNINISLGYHLQELKGARSFIDNFGNEITAEYDLLVKRFIVTFGIEFRRMRRHYK